jgi:hypothetical protein
VTDNTATVSSIIDCQGYDSVTLASRHGHQRGRGRDLHGAARRGRRVEPVRRGGRRGRRHGVDDGRHAPEAAASYTFADDAETRAIGYIGTKRYIRLTVTPAATTPATSSSLVWPCSACVRPA